MALLGAPADPSSPFDEHAFCRAADNGFARSALPSREAPVVPKHKPVASCCLCQFPGVQPPAIFASQPVAYARVMRSKPDSAIFAAEWRFYHAKARAPPILI
jgi:hypothetical protein